MTNNQERTYYYKLVQNKLPDGKVIDTNKVTDKDRYVRNLKLKKLFDLIYNYSLDYQIPIQSIFFELRPKKFQSIVCDVDFVDWNYTFLKDIKNEVNKSRFVWGNETKYFFNDYLIGKAQSETEFLNIDFPDRYKSNYFFESKVDCINYLNDIHQQMPRPILIVDFIEVQKFKKFDNRMINNFDKSQISMDLLINTKKYLRGELTNNPLIEVVFQGKYKIITTI
jgi:hypothetical protein